VTGTADRAAFALALEAVRDRISAACARSGRGAGDVTLVAVSKTVPAERLRSAVEAGQAVLGENRVQEAAAKAAELSGVEWHLVGPLQANKVRRAVELFSLIHSVDSVGLADRIGRVARETGRGPLPVLLQVNVDRDPGKAGFEPEALHDAVPALTADDGLEVRGLMTIGRLVPEPEQARGTFAALRALSEDLRRSCPPLGTELSMGMSDDFEIAIEEGATIVRVGRALFGERPGT
jgi:hypothetical protein